MTNDSAQRDLNDWADLLASAYAVFEPGSAGSPDFPELARGLNDLSLDDAYRVQDLVIERLGAAYGTTVSGYKIGGVGGLMAGVLLDRTVLDSGATIDPAAYNIPLVEPEILVRTTAELSGDVSLADIAGAVEVGAGFELPVGRFRGWHPTAPEPLMTLASMIADNALAGLVVLGDTWRPGLDPAEVGTVTVDVDLAGRTATGRPNPKVGTAYETTRWLIQNLAERDRVLPKGSIVASGTLLPPPPATPGEYVARFSHGLGEVRFTAA